MVVGKEQGAQKPSAPGAAYYFCSAGCQRTFESPEQTQVDERDARDDRLGGVLALAILRAAASSRWPRGATIVTWVPDPPTALVHLGHVAVYSGHAGAVHRRLEPSTRRVVRDQTRSINMDFLIALAPGGYFYSVAVIFFPEVLPVKVEEREVYFPKFGSDHCFFRLLGKYMEELIRNAPRPRCASS